MIQICHIEIAEDFLMKGGKINENRKDTALYKKRI